eukprot:876477-Pelagomonas_calceolata.AAC.4
MQIYMVFSLQECRETHGIYAWWWPTLHMWNALLVQGTQANATLTLQVVGKVLQLALEVLLTNKAHAIDDVSDAMLPNDLPAVDDMSANDDTRDAMLRDDLPAVDDMCDAMLQLMPRACVCVHVKTSLKRCPICTSEGAED